MSDKNMYITITDTFCGAELSWLPKHETRGEKWWLDLTGDTAPEEVDALLCTLAGCNKFKLDIEAPKDALMDQMRRQMDQRKLILPGGIRFEGDGYRIFPGCCSGVNNWLDTAWELEEYQSPWMGHDPNVSFLEKDGICYIANVKLTKHQMVKPYGGRYGGFEEVEIDEALRNERIKIIRWQPEEFLRCLDKLDRDFQEFLDGPLRMRMEQLQIEDGWARAFDRCFRAQEEP